MPFTPEEEKIFLEAQARLPDWKELNPARMAIAAKEKAMAFAKSKTRSRLRPAPQAKP